MFDILTGNHLRRVRQCGRFWIKDGLENIDNDDDDDDDGRWVTEH